MVRLLTAMVALALAGSALASATAGPRKDLRPIDQARARAMVLKRADLGAGWQALAGSGNTRSCPGLDLSHVTVTGMASSPAFLEEKTLVFGSAYVYASTRDAKLSLEIQAGPRGLACSTRETRRTYAGPDVAVTHARLILRGLAPVSAGYRFVVRKRGAVVFAIDSILLQRGRGQTAVAIGTSGGLPPRAQLLRLARALGSRLRMAMRGS